MNPNQNLEETAAQVSNYKMVDGKYYIKTTKLGKGNFAETNLATLKDNETIVSACKQIAKKSLIDKFQDRSHKIEDILINLKKQVNQWKQLDHPNIVKFIYFSETPNNIYFFLEYCNGEYLEKFIKNKERLSEKDIIDIFQQISQGCCYLNKLNIFHQDLKSENILIHNGIAKITDLATVNFIEYQQKDFYPQGRYVPIPYYKSPQVISGNTYSIKSNVWSLGIIFYEMLYGSLPWMNPNSVMQWFKAINEEKLTFPNTIQVSEGMKDLIIRMLQAKEEDRCDIKEVCEQLSKMKNDIEYRKTPQEEYIN